METNETYEIDLTDEQARKLEAIAKKNNMTPSETASVIASIQIARRFRTPKTQGKVIPFRQRGTNK